ncbi:MAG: zinc-binding alcohol dehydrogenase [Spirochaetes bacterium]|nr:zinc-binding alcohol dehydrogenase [Spirochaetota bacterium]
MEKRLAFTGKSQVTCETFSPAPLEKNQVGIRTRHSLMSTGTENIVFNRLFEAGSHWDRWVKYPFYPGYANVGVVEAVGSEVTSVKKGDLVVSRAAHASWVTVGEGQCVKVPEGIPSKDASWFALAKICAMGARAAQYTVADSVLVIGAGPIGQMSVRWAHALGVEKIACVDPVKSRLEFARRGGAQHVFDKGIDDSLDEIRKITDGGPRVVVDSTGNEKAFVGALQAARKYGRVVVLGDTGTPSGQHLSPDLITRGLTIVGAHDGHEDPAWNAPIILRFFFNLLQTGRFRVDGLVTHEFKGEEYQAAYDTANTRRGETMGILFNW